MADDHSEVLENSGSYGELSVPARFEAIYDHFSPKIYRYGFLRLSSVEDAEDIVANTFLRLWNYIRKKCASGYADMHIGSISALLFRIARNLIIDKYRGRHRSISLDALKEAGFEFPAAGSRNSTTAAEYGLTLDQLGKLPPDECDLLILRFVEDLPVKEIALLLDITENNASVRIHRALQKLKILVNVKLLS